MLNLLLLPLLCKKTDESELVNYDKKLSETLL